MILLQKKKFQFGSYAVILTVIVVALIIVLNVIVSALSNRFEWYYDMTPEKLYALSDQSKAYLSEVDGKKNKVTIYFLTEEDRLNLGVTSANGYGQSGYWGMQPIHALAKELDENFDYISVDYINANAEPERIRAIVGDDYDGSTFSQTTVIIDNYTEYTDESGHVYEEHHEYRVYPRETFFTYSYTTFAVSAFVGDYRFCSAIRSITMSEDQRPIAYFISGHNEDIGAYDYAAEDQSSIAYGSAQSLWQLFRDSGYTIRKIDLRYEDFDENREGVAVIYGPASDYISTDTSDQFDEIGKLERYLGSGSHSLMVFMNPKVMNLPNLEGFLEKNAGVRFDPVKLRDDGRSSISTYGLIGIPAASSGTAGSVISDLAALYPDGQRALFNEACSMTVSGGAAALYTVPASASGVPVGSADDFEVSESSALLTLTGSAAGGQILCCGTTALVDGSYVDHDGYANRDLVLRVMTEMNDSGRVSYGVPVKVIRDEGLDRTTYDVVVWTLALALGLPALFAAVGTVVYVRRRHS